MRHVNPSAFINISNIFVDYYSSEISEKEFLDVLNESREFPSIQMLKQAVGHLGFNHDLHQTHEAYQQAVKDKIACQLARLPEEQQHAYAEIEIARKVRASFKY